jgi:hypothetical protein
VVSTDRVGMPSSMIECSWRAEVGQACTQAPQETHSEARKSVPPALILESKPRPSTVSANVPWMSAQARTQREQTMHEEESKEKYGLESSTACGWETCSRVSGRP